MASYEIPGFTRSYEPAGDLTASWFKFVKLNGALADAASAATNPVIGVLQNKAMPKNQGSLTLTTKAPSSAATVMIDGVSRCFAGGAFAAGVPLTIDATGAVVAAGAGNPVVAVSETVSSGAGDLVSILLKPLGAVVV